MWWVNYNKDCRSGLSNHGESSVHTNALWPTERSCEKLWIHDFDALTAILAQVVALAKNVDGRATNQTMNTVQASGRR